MFVSFCIYKSVGLNCVYKLIGSVQWAFFISSWNELGVLTLSHPLPFIQWYIHKMRSVAVTYLDITGGIICLCYRFKISCEWENMWYFLWLFKTTLAVLQCHTLEEHCVIHYSGVVTFSYAVKAFVWKSSNWSGLVHSLYGLCYCLEESQYNNLPLQLSQVSRP